MDANEHEFIDELVADVIGAAYEVANTLGNGFLEKVYERALRKELAVRRRRVRTQASFSVMYKGESVGDYFADLIVEERLVVEIKCADQLAKEHMAQCINYLKAS